MSRFAFGVRQALIGLAVIVAASSPQAQVVDTGAKPAPVASMIEPKAVDIIKAASARLAAARSMSFTAVATFEAPSKLGPPLAYTTRSTVLLQRPDKLRVITPADGPPSEFYYDGRTMVAYAPAPDLAAVQDAPPTIDAALEKAFDSAAIYFPFTDVLVADPWAALGDGLVTAFYIGRSTVGEVATDMVALANDQVFLQMWIGVEDKLPRRIRAQFRDDALRLRHEVVLSEWTLDAAVPADAFTSAKVENARRVLFADPASAPPQGVKPITRRDGGAPRQPKSN